MTDLERPPGVMPMVPPQPIKAIGQVISSTPSSVFGSSGASTASRSTAFPGLTLAAMAFRQNVDLTVGARTEREIIYIDDAYTVSSLGTITNPQVLGISSSGTYLGPGTSWIKTRNSDLSATAANYLTFQVDQPLRVFLLLDPGHRSSGSRLPGFIANDPQWTAIVGESDTTNDPALLAVAGFAGLFVMRRDFDIGTIQLGGARSGGGGGNRCNYSVLVVRRS